MDAVMVTAIEVDVFGALHANLALNELLPRASNLLLLRVTIASHVVDRGRAVYKTEKIRLHNM